MAVTERFGVPSFLPHPLPSPAGRGKTSAALQTSDAPFCNDRCRPCSLSQRERDGVRENGHDSQTANKLRTNFVRPRRCSVISSQTMVPETNSSVCYAPLPHNCALRSRFPAAPSRRGRTPSQLRAAPGQRVCSPSPKVPAPSDRVPAPRQRVRAPKERVCSPTEKVRSPSGWVPSPRRKVPGPSRFPASPFQKVRRLFSFPAPFFGKTPSPTPSSA